MNEQLDNTHFGSEPSGKRRRAVRLSIAGVALAAVLAFAGVLSASMAGVGPFTGAGGADSVSSIALPKEDSLAVETDSGSGSADAASGPAENAADSRYSQESLQLFSGVLRAVDGQGVNLDLKDVPLEDYQDFIFEVADDNAASSLAGALATEQVRQIHDNLYAAASLDVLANYLVPDQLSYIEPNFTMHLIGEVDADSPSGTVDPVHDAAAADAQTGELGGSSVQPLGGTVANPAPDYPPTDPEYVSGTLWNLDMLNVQAAWEAGLDGDPYVYNGKALRDTKVRVAVIDTGLYGTGAADDKHEDLNYDNMLSGVNYVTSEEGTPDAHGHGTFVAGLIAAQVSNGVGVAGAQPGVEVVSEKVFDTGSAQTSDIIKAIYDATDVQRVDVINMSLGGEYNERSLEVACDYAVSKGVLVVASAGNDGVSTPNYPAAYDSVVGVASVNSSRARSTWSQFGKSVFVTGPGENVTSTFTGATDAYKTASGTSFSGPEVAALAAMCKSVYPDIDQDTFKQFLIETSTDLGGKGYDDYYGWGLVDFGAMAQAVLSSQVLPWYNISFDLVDENGRAIDVASATITLAAAEDISWDADEQGGIDEAGTWTAGTFVTQEEDRTFKVHRGNYSYTVVVDGKYAVSGTLKTYTEHQRVAVTLPSAYAVTLNVVGSTGGQVAGASHEVKARDGRIETPKVGSATEAQAVYDLASGIYTYCAAAAGYESASGTFTVQHAAKTINAVLYRPEELATVSFVVSEESKESPVAGATVTVTDDSGVSIASQPDGTWRLAKGASYTATASKAGFESASKGFTVESGDAGQTVELSMRRASNLITFKVEDEGGKAVSTATAKVATSAGEVVDSLPDNKLQFSLVEGDYTYEVSAPGYSVKTGGFGVALDSYTISVVLEAKASTVAFAVSDAQTGAAIGDATVKVNLSDRLRAIEQSAPNTYLLTPGNYDYTVFKEGYQTALGTFEVAGEGKTIKVALTSKAEGAGYAGGSGTEEDPYLIATEDQLRYLAGQTDIVRATSTTAATNKKVKLEGHWRLIADIELTGGDWLPIGNSENGLTNYVAFAGEFDGGGHTISGVRISNNYDYQGLFGYVHGAYIHDLVVDGEIHVNGKSASAGGSYVGGLVGGIYASNDPLYTSNNTSPTVIERCGNLASVTGRYAVAGIVGSAQGATPSTGLPDGAPDEAQISIVDCYNRGTIRGMLDDSYMRQTGTGLTAAGKRAGGIVGSAQYTLIKNCYNAGDVQAGSEVGGIAAYSNIGRIAACYNSGLLYQHSNASGDGGKTGAASGSAVRTSIEHTYGMNRSDNYGNVILGSSGYNATTSDTAMLDHASIYRTDSFVETLNAYAVSSGENSAYVLGHDYPMLYWEWEAEGTSGAKPACTPVVVEQPQGIDEVDAYMQGSQAQQLTAAIEDIPEDEGSVTWQWFVSDTDSFKGAVPAPSGIGSGMRASYKPSTEETGAKYYFCVFTNRLGLDLKANESSAVTSSAAIYVRGTTAAATPVITELNPNSSQTVNTNLSVKQGTDLQLSVTATVADEGTVSYQWFSSSTGSGVGNAINGATSRTWLADTATLGTSYYYVEVTNTLGPGNVSKAISDWIEVKVDSYTISNYQELVAFRTTVNSGNAFDGQIVYLLEDIAMPDGVDWTPIGVEGHPFSGTFMGGTGYAGSDPDTVKVHAITKLAINGDAHGNDCLGLFGVVRGATIADVQVGGVITGQANTNTGLLVGQAYSNGSVASSIENCATLAGSRVEGAWSIGGLLGYSGADVSNCANHADVRAYAYAGALGSGTVTADSKYAVGGVSGYQNGGTMLGCYNTGTIKVESPSKENGTACATRVGGVAGSTGYYSGMASCFNDGKLEIAVVVESQYERGVLYAGAVCGYLNSGNGVNNYYKQGTWSCGTDGSDHIDAAEMRSAQFMKTNYFTELLNKGTGSYSYGQFRTSQNGVPHLVWEAENTSDDGICSAEPYITNITSVDFPSITSTFKGTYFQNTEYFDQIVVWADTPDGGAMRYEWRMREAGAADDAWKVVASGGMAPDASGKNGQAPVTVDVSKIGTFEYQCEVYNKRDGATVEPYEESMSIPVITITVKDASGVMSLRVPGEANSKENPWVIDTPAKMKFFADIVNGDEAYRPITDPTFTGQYVQLTADIDISGYAPWTPVGSNTSTYNPTSGVFSGVFDGADHVVRGLTVVNPGRNDYNGLFGQARMATIRNVEVAGTVQMDSASAYGTGGLVAYAYGCFIENVVNRVNVTGAQNTGGIAGNAGSSKILDCENLGAVSMNAEFRNGKYGGYDVGGIAGAMFNGAGAPGAGVYNCFNNGTVSGNLYDGDYRIGALVGGTGAGISAQDSFAHNYYRADSIVVEGGQGSGIGGGSYKPVADKAGVCMPVASTDSPETAYALDTSDATVYHSARWGNYARADVGESNPCVHLVRASTDAVTYRIDAASESALIETTLTYAKAGDSVDVTWKSKPGFTVQKVSWRVMGGDNLYELGTGPDLHNAVTFAMPAGDVQFVVQAERDTTHRYGIESRLMYGNDAAPSEAGSVSVETDEQGRSAAGGQVGVVLSVADGYQVRRVDVADVYGNSVQAQRVDGLHYSFAMPAADVVVTVMLEDAGSQADAKAVSLAVNAGATHVGTADGAYKTADLLYDTVAFSGSFFAESLYLGQYTGGEIPKMAIELEGARSPLPALYSQDYGVYGKGVHRYTGTDLAALIEALAGKPVPASTPVLIESADGPACKCTYGDIASLAYSRYDATGQPEVRGLPVLLYYGVDSKPNLNGAMGVVFGQTFSTEDNSAKVVSHVSRICVGDNVNFSQHVWGNSYIDYKNMDVIAGGKANDTLGYTDLTIRMYKGTGADRKLVRQNVLSLAEIEAMARNDRSGIQRGYYSTYLYESAETASDGPYCDYYEGYDLYKVLKAIRVPYEPEATVQFYQSGMNGLDNSWKTVSVSLGYIAGNGNGGEGDYSNNTMTYVTGSDGTSPVGAGTLTNLKPMLVYGKNGLPLVWGSGTDPIGYQYGMYNYRGPMMAFLPQNAVEGGPHVGAKTATSCYLGLIDVYLPASADVVDTSALASVISAAKAAESGVGVSADGADVEAGKQWTTAAARKALDDAIAAAQKVAGDPDATQSQVDNADSALRKAIDAYNASKKPGGKQSGPSTASGSSNDSTVAGDSTVKGDAGSNTKGGKTDGASSGAAMTPAQKAAAKALASATPVALSAETLAAIEVDASIPKVASANIATTANAKTKKMTVKVPGATSGVSNCIVAFKKKAPGKKKKWSSWTYSTTGAKTSYTISKLKAKGLVQVKVASVKDGKRGGWSSASLHYFQGVSKLKVKAKGKRFTVSWKKNTDATGFQVRYSTSKSMKNAKTVTANGKKAVKKVVSKLKAGKTYYVQVRPVKKVSGKTYVGNLSAKKKVKVSAVSSGKRRYAAARASA